jgi:hypothetical protein
VIVVSAYPPFLTPCHLQGDHAYHTFVVDAGTDMDMPVAGPETSFDWIWSARVICDCDLKYKYSIEC